ncbi:Rv2175c family DNA-binding protein [Janibacter alkaliphilus]|uniref:Helix-turn-helix domain-containing protein n=1 Tax=Janibacter alkaliphilus TaxID=1069963 RepID=A0A852X8S6_9MICO|nr:hypothetical protein [Janibacter alkaliphilus]
MTDASSTDESSPDESSTDDRRVDQGASSQDRAPAEAAAPGSPVPAPDPLDELEWLTLPDLAERLGLRLTQVRRLLDDRVLVGIRRGERRVLSVPADFLDDEGPLPALAGTFTVLADSGLDDAEIIAWMTARDETLPGGPTPLAAIRAGHKTEVRRRAMEEAL